jgi:hypothetical protein
MYILHYAYVRIYVRFYLIINTWMKFPTVYAIDVK